MDEALKRDLEELAELLKLFPDSLQAQVFDLVMEGGAPALASQDVASDSDAEEDSSSDEGGAGGSKRPRRKGASATSHSIVGDLDLRGDGSHPAFADFTKDKRPKTDAEFNTVAVYYLAKHCEVDDIGQDHIYTCYKAAKRKVPTNMAQSVRNAKERMGSLDFDRGIKRIRLTTIGENLVEHELPHAAKAPKS